MNARAAQLHAMRTTPAEIDEELRVIDSLLQVGVSAALNNSIDAYKEIADLLMVMQDRVKALRTAITGVSPDA